jgi:hypothetical protein
MFYGDEIRGKDSPNTVISMVGYRCTREPFNPRDKVIDLLGSALVKLLKCI